MTTSNITLLDGNQQTQTFAAIDDAAAYILRYPQATFTIYAPREVYDMIRKQVFDQENREDDDSVWNYRMMKGSVTSWSDIDDLNDMIEAVYARINERERRLSYGGDRKK